MEKGANQDLSESNLLSSNLFLSIKMNCYLLDKAIFDEEVNWYLVDKVFSDRDLMFGSNLLPSDTLYSILWQRFAGR